MLVSYVKVPATQYAIHFQQGQIRRVLLPFTPSDVHATLELLLEGKARARRVTMAEAIFNDGQRMLAFNDIFIGARSHVSARYTIRSGRMSEVHSSSGVLVSTGAGSTGWLSSVFQMANGVSAFSGGRAGKQIRLDWEDPRLVYVVREPFVSRHSSAEIVAGMIEQGDELVLESIMASGGCLFSDGIESDFIDFNSGAIARIRTAAQHAQLITL